MAALVSGSNEWTLVTDVTNYSSVDLGFVNLTDTSTWTEIDVNSDIKTLAISGSNYNKITMNAMSGSKNNCWINGTVCDAPRWHTPLYVTDSIGQNIRAKSDDNLAVVIKIERGDVITDTWAAGIVFGICVDPTSNTLATLNGAGAIFSNTATAVPDYGVWTVNSATVGGTNSATGAFVTSLLAAGLVQSTAIIIQSDGTLDNKNSRNNNASAMSADQDLSLIVGIGTRTASDAVLEDEDVSFRIQYKAIRLVSV